MLWRAWDGESLQPADRDYTVFLHLRDGAGRTVADGDSAPVWFVPRPTSAWGRDAARAETHLFDVHRMPLPAELPSGSFDLVVGWYDASSGARLPVVDPAGNIAGNEFVLGTVTIGCGAHLADLACLMVPESCDAQ